MWVSRGVRRHPEGVPQGPFGPRGSRLFAALYNDLASVSRDTQASCRGMIGYEVEAHEDMLRQRSLLELGVLVFELG